MLVRRYGTSYACRLIISIIIRFTPICLFTLLFVQNCTTKNTVLGSIPKIIYRILPRQNRTFLSRKPMISRIKALGCILSGWSLYFLYFVLRTFKVQSTTYEKYNGSHPKATKWNSDICNFVLKDVLGCIVHHPKESITLLLDSFQVITRFTYIVGL